MCFILGPPPDDADFAPEQGGWRRLREMGPRTLMVIGSLAGVPLSALFAYGWSRIPGTALTFSFDVMSLGRWGPVLLPLLLILTMAVFFGVLIFVHELIHALACPGFGLTSATFLGVWPSKILAYASHNGPISFGRGIFVGMAPFLVLSVAPLLVAFAGGPHWQLLTVTSVMNSMVCGGDVVICLMFSSQIPHDAMLRNKGWDTWWRPNPHPR